MSKGYLQSMWGQGKKVLFFDNWDEVTPSKGPLAVVLAYNSSRTALMSALLLVSALSHGAEQSGAERSGEERNNKCPGKTTAVGFGIVPRSGAEQGTEK